MKESKWLYKGEFKEMKGIILESRGGAKKSNAQRNPDYKLLLQYVVENLKNNATNNVEIYIASTREIKYPTVSDRLLFIDGKSKIDFAKLEVDDFISKLSKEIKLSGQSGTEKGGNSTKRLFFHIQHDTKAILPADIEQVPEQKTNTSTKNQVLKVLQSFQFEFKRPTKTNNTDLKVLVTDLQNKLKYHLETSISNFTWQVEYKPDANRKDSFDIYGHEKATNKHIVIELDPHRADSIAKKFVSRISLMAKTNLLYIAYLYPGTDKMPKNEANKYLLDCEAILKFLDSNSDTRKEFLGYYLEK